MQNKFIAALVSVLFLVPCISSAAPLTQTQAESLITVVQSSPGTPASVFANLITVFSKITTAQAESLIGIVQVSPGTAPSAFVNLLISFTQDSNITSVTTQTPVTPQVAPYVEPATIAITEEQRNAKKPPLMHMDRLIAWANLPVFKNGIHGLVDLWTEMLVTEGSQNIILNNGDASMEYFIDGVSIGHPELACHGCYRMIVDTAKYPNGQHKLDINVVGRNGTATSGSMDFVINNQ